MTQMQVTVPTNTKKNYTIHIQADLVKSLWADLEKDFPRLKKFIVTDSNVVDAGHLKNLIKDHNVPTFIIDPPGEISKHINTLVAIIEKMEKAYLGRDTLIVALGGGTVGDIAGFAAAVFKRGVSVVHIPTTTVAQADSSIGGKTGVDSTISKNAFGAFFHPDAVYIDTNTLATLDDLQYRSGLVESVKHALIADVDYFNFIETNIEPILNRTTPVLERIAYLNTRIKSSVVAEDPTEKNKRRILNYGHTIGHAVETASNYKLLHGQAVAVGIVAAGLIEKELKLADDDRLQRIKNVLGKLDMPLKIPREMKKDALIDIIKHDKKAVAGWPKFVLLEKIGKTLCTDNQWAHEVPKELIEKVIDNMY